ncbi:unnamed protein product [Prorocentrum cordatum]|uniref:Fungal lipase-type domain-containing protein n=1 Tax=Prorocentrum cordatum TaxID=2364126 RepID=A0ABN9XW50_9DINO|nr:unnamed protein product [Polarella glacialis]
MATCDGRVRGLPMARRGTAANEELHSLLVAYSNYVDQHSESCCPWIADRRPHSFRNPLLTREERTPEGTGTSVKDKLEGAIMRQKEREIVKYDQLLDDIKQGKVRKLTKQLPFMLPIRGRSSSLTLAYKVWLRFLVAYASCLCIMLLLAWFSGFLMEIFCSIFVFVPDVSTPDADSESQSFSECNAVSAYIGFLLLPFLIVFTAFLGDEFCDLVLDSVQEVPLTLCRATILAAAASPLFPCRKQERAAEPIPNWTYVAVEICLVICLNVVPGCCAFYRVLTTYQVGPSIKAFIAGSSYGVLAIAFLFAVADVRISCDHKREKLRDVIHEELRSKHVFPCTCSLWLTRGIINHNWAYHKEEWAFADQEWNERLVMHAMSKGEDDQPKGLARSKSDIASTTMTKNCGTWLVCVFVCLVSWAVTVCATRHVLSYNSMYGTGSSTRTSDVRLGVLACACVLVTVVSLLSCGIRKNLPRILGGPFFAILVFFMSVSSVILLSEIYILPTPDLSPLMTVERDNAFMPSCGGEGDEGSCDPHHPWNGSDELAKYPVCNMAWGAATATLSSLDLAGLAHISGGSYAVRPEDINELLHRGYNFSGRHGHHTPNYDTPISQDPSPYKNVPRVLEIFFPSKIPNRSGTRVFAIKGTSTSYDAVTDASFFAGIEVLQLFNHIFPVLTVFPEWRIQWLLRPTLNQHTEDTEQSIFEEVEQRIKRSKKAHPADQVILTGHSLGGGIAQIVAARTGIPALVWSAPGILFSAHRFAKNVQHPWSELIRFEELAKRSVTVVVPDLDPVPRVDEQIGMVQPVECRGRDGKLPFPWDCHPIKKTACEIWRVCGDPMGRDFRHACNDNNVTFHVNPSNKGEPYQDDDADVSAFDLRVRRSVVVVVGVIISSFVGVLIRRRAQIDEASLGEHAEAGHSSGSGGRGGAREPARLPRRWSWN